MAQYRGWRCPDDGEKMRAVNSLQRDESTRGVKRRTYHCNACGRNISTEERVVNSDRVSTYLPRPGQYRGGPKR